jgi:hypothetical protein
MAPRAERKACACLDAKKWSGVVLPDLPGAKKDLETVCEDKSGVYVDGD